MHGIFDVDAVIAKVVEKLDVDALVSDFMSRIKLRKLSLYFVVDEIPDCGEFHFLGMAYSLESAREIRDGTKTYRPQILQLSLGKLLWMAVQSGGAAKVQ
jgi:hypothetical protein